MNLAQSVPDIGSPVNPVLGANVLAGDEDLDFILDGPLPLEWQRHYYSTNMHEGWFGRGWSSRLEVKLEAVPDVSGQVVDYVNCIDMFGRRIKFPPLSLGEKFFSPKERLTLARTEKGQYHLSTPEGLTYWFNDRIQAIYRLASIVDRNGNAIHLEYGDAIGKFETVYISCSGKQQLELIFRNLRLSEILERRLSSEPGQHLLLMKYEYTLDGDLRRVINRANECVRMFGYDTQRLMNYQVYAIVFEAWYEYRGSGEESVVIRHWDNVGQSWTFDYHPTHTIVTDQDGRISFYHVDANQRWTGYTDPLGRFIRYGIDQHGNLRAVVDPVENVTETLFDDRSNPIEHSDAAGAVTTFKWHPTMPLLIAITDPLNRVMRYEYDERGNLVLETDPAGGETRYILDARGLIVAIVDANGRTSRLRYNDRGQVIEEIDCSGQGVRYDYDDGGLLVCITDALNQKTTYAYDAIGRLQRETRPDGGYEDYTYDTSGRLVKLTNALGATAQFRYAPDGLVIEEINALGRSLAYRYDSCRRLAELVNENGARYQFFYDVLDRLVEECRFDGTRSRYEYDTAGQMVQSIDEQNSPDVIVTYYRRDPLGRVLEKATPSLRCTFKYDAAGQLIEARDAQVQVNIKYDKAGQVVEESLITPTEARVVRFTYDPVGNRLSTILPDDTKLSTLYYGCGHAHQIRINDQSIGDIERDVLHREVGRSQGKLTTSWRYSSGGHLLEQRAYASGLQLDSELQEINRSYSYDFEGRLISAIDRGKHLSYGYDAIDRLTRFNDEAYIFDPAHNMVSASGSPSAPVSILDNRVTAYEDTQYRYDAHGRVIEKRIGEKVLIQFTWDDWHRLVESSTNDHRGRLTTQYVYDPLGRRIVKRSEEGVVGYTWDEDMLLEQHDGRHAFIFVYEQDSFVPLAQVVKTIGLGNQDTTLYYYHCDQVGLPRELTNGEGEIVWEGSFRGWGRLSSQRLGAKFLWQEQVMPVSTVRYQGQLCDEETGLYYNLMRYYDPDWGRFVSRDPIGLIGGLNEYLYVPNPTGWIDPWGLTGTYIMSGGRKVNYVGKGAMKRSKQSARQRLGGCQKTVVTHSDYGDNEMGFMVEHLIMVARNARLSKDWANSPKLDSPGKKKYAKATSARQDAANAKAKALMKKHDAEKKACGL
ncbi:MAG: RHS repeat-associated core domain-containing protein [Nitrosospira sp.]